MLEFFEYYKYFAACLLAIPIYLLFFIKPSNRKAMLHGSFHYVAILAVPVLVLLLLGHQFSAGSRSIYPGYGNPNTLFDLAMTTHIISIEDILFMFLVGGVASIIVESITKKKLLLKNKKHHILAFVLALVFSGIFHKFSHLNGIWTLIFFNTVGTLSIWFLRKDLIKHSILGGLIFCLIYFFFIMFILMLFPDAIANQYNLKNLSGIIFYSVPIEELLYCFTFGLFWSPEIEYEYDIKSKI